MPLQVAIGYLANVVWYLESDWAALIKRLHNTHIVCVFVQFAAKRQKTGQMFV